MDTFPVLVNDHWLRIPKRLSTIVGVDTSQRPGVYFEPWVMLGIEAVVRTGMTVFDVGCSYGIVSCLLARRVGPAGRVMAFEANPAVLAEAAPLVALNSQPGQVEMHEACVGESSVGVARFFTLRGANSVASTRNADIRHFHSDSIERDARLLALDDFVRSRGMVPDCVKLDVEGSECVALRGASKLIEGKAPDWIIETHGLEVDGIGGSVAEVCRMLADRGYGLVDLCRAEETEAGEFSARYRNHIGYLLASRRAGGLIAGLRRRWREILVR